MKKKFLTFILSLCFILPCSFMLVACGSNPDGDNPPPVEYKITFVVEGNDNYHSITFDGKSEITLPTDPSKDYFRFDGWFFDNNIWSNQLTTDYFVTNPITSDVSVYAKMTDIAEYYTVTFETNGGSTVDSILNVRENLTITKPDNPTKENCEFLGWYRDSSFVNEWNFATDTISGNTTLYAKWLQNYLVTYVLNYSGATNVERFTVGGLVDYIPSRTGYIFNGWYLSEGEIAGNYILTEKFDTNEMVVAEGLVLYAEWVEEPTISTQLPAPIVYIDKTDETLNWEEIEGATGYNIVVYSNGSEINNYTTSTPGYTMGYFESGNYVVKICALGDGINTVNSVYTTKYYSLRVLSAPQNIEIDITTSIVSWDAVDNATQYEIYVNGNYVKTTTDCQFDMTNYDAGSYSVKIVATADDYISSNRTATCIKRKLIAPLVQVSFDSATQVYTFAWNQITNANKYYIYINGVQKTSTSSNTIEISKNSTYWNDLEELQFYVTAFDTNTNYLMSIPSNELEIVRKYSISAVKNYNEAGNIAISSNCENFCGIAGESYTISVNINDGYNFEGWFDGATQLSNEISYTFTMPASDVVLEAVFSNYAVTTTINNENAGTITQYTNRNVSNGETVELTATTNEGYNFVGWFDAVEYASNPQTATAKSTNETYEFTMGKQNVNLIAVFNYYTIITSTNIAEAGSTNYETLTKVSIGEQVTLTATTNNGYNFVGWFNQNNQLVSNDASFSFIMTAQNIDYVAKYNYFTVVTSIDIAGAGTTNYSAETKVSVGEEVTLLATTNAGYNFIGWYDENDNLVSDSIEYKFTMTEQNVMFVAKFSYYTVTTSMLLEGITDENLTDVGSITEYSNKEISIGEQVTIVANAKSGYNFVGWFDAEEYAENSQTATAKSTNLTYQFTMGEESVNLVAVYDFYTLTVTMLDANAGTLTGAATTTTKISNGTNINLSVAINDGYIVKGWFDAEEYSDNSETATALSSLSTYNFTMGRENKNIIFVNDYEELELNIVVNGESYQTISYTLAETPTLPSVNVEGQKVAGWHKDENLTISYNGNINSLDIVDNKTYLYIGTYDDKSANCTFTYHADTDSYTVSSSYTGSTQYLPATYNNKRVVGIDNLYYYTNIKTLIIPNTYTLKEGQFANYTKLESLTIPYVGATANEPTSGEVIYPFGYLFAKSLSTGLTPASQYTYTYGSTYTTTVTYYIPTTLKNVTVTGGYINNYAFKNVSNLVSINIENLASAIIGDYAFDSCTALKNISLPANATTTGTELFNECRKIQTATIPTDLISLLNPSIDSLVSITFNGGAEVYFEAFTDEYTSLTDLYLGDSITTIKRLPSTSDTLNIHINDISDWVNVTHSQYSSFENAKLIINDVALEGEYTFPSTVTKVPDYAFAGYKFLTKVTIPDSVTEIGTYAFGGIEEGLTTVIIGGGVENIVEKAFYSSKAITSLTLSEGLKTIGESAFHNLSITELTIPNSVTEIGTKAFEGCRYLKTLDLGTNIKKVSVEAFSSTVLETIYVRSAFTAYSSAFAFGATSSTSSENCIRNVYFDSFDLMFDVSYNYQSASLAYNVNTTYYYKDSDKYVAFTEITEEMDITEYGNYQFYDYDKLTSIVFNSNLTSLGNYSFNGNNLTYLEFTNDLVLASYSNTFVTLEDVVVAKIPAALISYLTKDIVTDLTITSADGGYTIDAFTVLENLTVADATVYGGTITNNTQLKNITYGKGVVSIGSSSLAGCTALENVIFNADTITVNSFANATIQNLIFNSSQVKFNSDLTNTTITNIYLKSWFENTYTSGKANPCYLDTTNVYLNNELITSETVLEIPETVETVPAYSLSYLDIATLVVPSTVISFEANCAYNCVAIDKVVIESINQWVGYGTWQDSKNPMAYGGTLYIGDEILTHLELDGAITPTATTFNHITTITSASASAEMVVYVPKTNLETITITSGTTISNSAFADATKLTTITIPDFITSIGASAFTGTTASIVWGENPSITEITKQVYKGYLGTEIVIPDSITTLCSGIFRDCINLESLTIPTITSTDLGLAYYFSTTANSEMTKISLSSTYYYLPKNLKNIVVTGITATKFTNLTMIEKVDISNVTELTTSMFSGCTKLKEVKLPDGLTALPNYSFYNCAALTTINLENITEFGNYAFYGCSAIKSIDLSNVVSVGDYALQKCSSITSIDLSNLTSIGQYAFAETGLINVSIPESFTSLPAYIFNNCASLESISFGTSSNVETIGKAAFAGTAITTITLPSKVTTISEWLFSNCTNLQEFTIESHIVSISDCAFYKCTSLGSIIVPDTVTSFGDYMFGNTGAKVYFERTTQPYLDSIRDYNSYNYIDYYLYSETTPTDTTKNYWHYVDGVVTIWGSEA